MSQPREASAEPAAPAPVAAAGPQVVVEAGRQLRAPWAASLAGILFAVLFTVAMVLMRGSPLSADSNVEMARLFAEGRDQWLLIGGLYLAPFAGIMFLWFIAVIRDQLGDREDRFFATVFFGSGLLFVALLFAAAAVASAVAVGYRYLGLEAPSVDEIQLVRSLAYTLLFAFASRAAAVFLVSIATVGLQSRTFPRWLGAAGYLFSIVLLLVVSFWDWIVLLLPAWVGVASLFIFRRERSLQRAQPR